MSDTTDNVTGEREVYAFRNLINDSDYVTLTLRCHAGKPSFYVEWQDQKFPDQVVLTIGPALNGDTEPSEHPYVFEKSTDIIERGLRASPETSAAIISAIGAAPYLTITAHLTSGSRLVGMEVAGTPGAWGRVSRHCPVKKMSIPAP